MRPVRKIFDTLENHTEGKWFSNFELIYINYVLKYTAPAQSQSYFYTGHSHMPIIRLETVTTEDFLQVIAHTKPSARNLTKRFSAWEREYESVWAHSLVWDNHASANTAYKTNDLNTVCLRYSSTTTTHTAWQKNMSWTKQVIKSLPLDNHCGH